MVFSTRLRDLRDAALGTVGAALDRFVVGAALDLTRDAPDPERVARHDHSARLAQLARVTEAYGDPRYLEEPDSFFARPDAPRMIREARVKALARGGEIVDLAWESAFEPVHGVAREDYLGFVENRTAHARLWRHGDARPTVVCVHGYLGGHMPFEETAFQVAWMYGLGLDVALAVLPFHAARCPPGRQGMFPGRDPWRTVEGFAQAVSDLRSLVAWLSRQGSPRVGTFGMSLGGYTASLLATVDERADFTVLMVPLASLADVYFEHRAGRPEAPPEWVRPRIEDAYKVVSPFARRPRVDPASALVLAANGDRITPITHAERLRAHLGEADMHVFPGGHLLQAGRGRAFGAVARFFARRHLIVST